MEGPTDGAGAKTSTEPLTPERVQLTGQVDPAGGLKEALRLLRERRGLSQSEVANALDVAPAVVSGWETGSRQPSVDRLLQLAGLYGLDLGDLSRALEIATGGPTPPSPARDGPPPAPGQLARLLLGPTPGELPVDEEERALTELLEGVYRLAEQRRRVRSGG